MGQPVTKRGKNGQFQPGHRSPGRPKGIPNAFNAQIKDMILGALSDVGGRRYLAQRALDQPVAFMALVGRVLPYQLAGEAGAPISVDFTWAPAQPMPTIELEAEPEQDAAD